MEDDLSRAISDFVQFVYIFRIIDKGRFQVIATGTDGRYSILLQYLLRNSCILVAKIDIFGDLIYLRIEFLVLFIILYLGKLPIEAFLTNAGIL
jgi:hypothetical protein